MVGVSERMRRGEDAGEQAVLLAAGLAELAWSTCGGALRTVRGLLGRSDLGDLAQQGQRDLRARGRLALDRLGTGGEAHMEVLARHARARSAGGTGA
ncbi:polyprenyl synthetase [Streptomyces fuscigenes]|uniref:polyprenyl synthetase n=1 Tax=Streptomyces fuscigenes TaxID=1528880 RepID=UPI001F2F05B1|nr:polyprenyl synthetase [Streptomyces fuscigenes]MCF3964966.1 polyprenyl synthetase [Streptomyces fuscigenes]